MVLERIVSVEKVEAKPYYAACFGAIITLIAILVGYRVFQVNAGMATLAFIVIGSLPFLRKLIAIEEAEEATANTFKKALARNRQVIEKCKNYSCMAFSKIKSSKRNSCNSEKSQDIKK